MWVRGERYYHQIRVLGEKSPRRIPLTAATLSEAREEAAKGEGQSERGRIAEGKGEAEFFRLRESSLRLEPPQRQKAADGGAGEQWKKAPGHGAHRQNHKW